CAVDQHVDTAPFFQNKVNKALQIVVRLVGAGDADAAQFLRQCLALAGGRKNCNLETVLCKPACGSGAHAASASRHNRYFFYCHDAFLSGKCCTSGQPPITILCSYSREPLS